eukprot:scaffold333_cov230-Pinguiococcus_pyrenoidosus.AAC.2
MEQASSDMVHYVVALRCARLSGREAGHGGIGFAMRRKQTRVVVRVRGKARSHNLALRTSNVQSILSTSFALDVILDERIVSEPAA